MGGMGWMGMGSDIWMFGGSGEGAILGLRVVRALVFCSLGQVGALS